MKPMKSDADDFAMKKVYISRDLPNCIGAENEVYNAKIWKAEFYPEDKARMKAMSREEMRKFKDELIKAGRYTRIDYTK